MTKIKISELKSDIIRQEALPKGFIVRVQKYKEILREVETTTLEETINNFQRDSRPEVELTIWETIARCYELKVQNSPKWTIVEKERAFLDILTLSLG